MPFWTDQDGAGVLTTHVSSRLSEPDPSHTLEERVVHWYFKLLDKNNSGDIGKKEIKPFKRFLRKREKKFCSVFGSVAQSVSAFGC